MQLQGINEQIKEKGARLIALSGDAPADLKETIENHGIEYTLLSDAGVAFGQAMGVAFKAGRGALPVPSVFIADTKGHIRFVHADPKYSQRLDPQVMLAAIGMAAGR